MLKNKNKLMYALIISSLVFSSSLDVANAGGLFDFGAYENAENTESSAETDPTGGGLFDFGTSGTTEATETTESSAETDPTGGGLFDFGTSGTTENAETTESSAETDPTGGGLFDFGTSETTEATETTESSAETDPTGGGLFDFGTSGTTENAETTESSAETDPTGGGLFDFGTGETLDNTDALENADESSIIEAQTHESEPNMVEAQTHDSDTDPVIIRIRRIIVPVKVSVMMDEVKTEFNSFRIGGDYFFKLEDIAVLFNGTDKQFSIHNENVQQIMGGVNPEDLETVVDTDTLSNLGGNVISIKTNSSYTPNGSELSYENIDSDSLDKELSNTTTLLVDDVIRTVETYNVLGNEVFAMEDICRILDANFDFPETSSLKQIIVDTNKNY